MIVGLRTARGLLLSAAALTLALGTALTAPASAVGATVGSWVPAWSWGSGSHGLPNGCAPYSGRASAGMRWSPTLVRVVGGRLRLTTTGGRAGADLAGSGIGCKGRAQRYARVAVRARVPQAAGLVARIALWPSTAGRGSDWSGLTVPSEDIGPAYATNGSGDEAHGADVPGRLAGAFHDYLITWSPDGFSVAVDGRTVYRDSTSFDRPRWLGISLSATGPSTARAHLMVEKVVADTWTPSDAPGTTAGARTAALTAALAANAHGTAGTVLDLTHRTGALPMGGALVALGVLLGVVRAARAARRRSPDPG